MHVPSSLLTHLVNIYRYSLYDVSSMLENTSQIITNIVFLINEELKLEYRILFQAAAGNKKTIN